MFNDWAVLLVCNEVVLSSLVIVDYVLVIFLLGPLFLFNEILVDVYKKLNI